MKHFGDKDKKATDECYTEVAEKFQNSAVTGKLILFIDQNSKRHVRNNVTLLIVFSIYLH